MPAELDQTKLLVTGDGDITEKPEEAPEKLVAIECQVMMMIMMMIMMIRILMSETQQAESP